MHDETWRPVPRWESYYEVSDLGQVRSLPRNKPHWRGGTMRVAGRILKQATLATGYQRVTLQVENRREQRDVQTLVAEAFFGSRPRGEEVRHKDGNRRNNRADNLEYGTSGQNRLDSVAHGTHRNSRKEECKRRHLLAGPNLMFNNTSKGTPARKCRSCNTAMQTGKRQGWYPDEEAWQRVADELYRTRYGTSWS